MEVEEDGLVYIDFAVLHCLDGAYNSVRPGRDFACRSYVSIEHQR
jgi:hypothetical protein